MSNRPYEWRVGVHGCYKFDDADLGFEPRDQTAHFFAYFHIHTTNFPGPDSISRSSQAQQRRMERAAGECDRKRIRQNLAQQVTSNPLACETRVRLDRCFQCFRPLLLWTFCFVSVSVSVCSSVFLCFCVRVLFVGMCFCLQVRHTQAR